MIEHNVSLVGGVEYKAVKCNVAKCSGCVGEYDDILCGALDSCLGDGRADGEDVKYKRHYRPRHNELPIKVIEL